MKQFTFLTLLTSLSACYLGCFARPSTQQITWGNCSTSDPPGLECAKFKVPLDWNNRQGGSITLDLTRLKSLKPSKRIGSLFFNAGGPGAGAKIWIQSQANGVPLFSNSLVEHFDLVGIDPRGTGPSALIKCDPTLWNERVSLFPKTQAEFDKLIAHNKAVGESCLKLTGPLLGFVDTTSVVHDFEAVRLALGEDKMNYFGYSYGTQLGSQYAELYPDNIRTMVLDGNLDHSQAEIPNLVTETMSYEVSFLRFAEWCKTTSTCALSGKDIPTLFSSLVKQANTKPIPAPGCVESGACRPDVNGEEILLNFEQPLVFKTAPLGGGSFFKGWAELAQSLSEALSGNATLLSSALVASSDDGAYGGLAISCMDWTSNSGKTLPQMIYKQQLANILAPNTHGASQTYTVQASCNGWPIIPRNPPRTLRINTEATILEVHAEYDPSTSISWAHSLREQMSNVVLLTRAGDGHTSYMLNGSTARAMDAYLVNQTLPLPGTVLTD
jgi:pimeloyl-ACP methyl ester carboxylesterase